MANCPKCNTALRKDTDKRRVCRRHGWVMRPGEKRSV